MNSITRFLVRFWFDDKAQDLVEYALIVGVVSVGAAAVLPGPAAELSVVWSRMISLTDNAGQSSP